MTHEEEVEAVIREMQAYSDEVLVSTHKSLVVKYPAWGVSGESVDEILAAYQAEIRKRGLYVE